MDRSTNARSKLSVLVLCEWCLEWPPYVKGENGRKQLQLILEGEVLGRHARFEVAKRIKDHQFLSTKNETVRIEGCLDVERAKAVGVPPLVVELMLDGLPAYWERQLERLTSGGRKMKVKER